MDKIFEEAHVRRDRNAVFAVGNACMPLIQHGMIEEKTLVGFDITLAPVRRACECDASLLRNISFNLDDTVVGGIYRKRTVIPALSTERFTPTTDETLHRLPVLNFIYVMDSSNTGARSVFGSVSGEQVYVIGRGRRSGDIVRGMHFSDPVQLLDPKLITHYFGEVLRIKNALRRRTTAVRHVAEPAVGERASGW